MHLRLKGESLTIRRLGVEHQDAMVAFARGLPEQDLLFLERDITRTAEVDQWIAEVAHGNLVTMVAFRGDAILGYASFDRGSASWTRHVAELRLVVAKSARGLGIGRLLLELAFELALEQGVTKLVARMTPNQAGALNLFQRLGFEEEAVLREHARDAKGQTYDLHMFSYYTHKHQGKRCSACGAAILTALSLDGGRLCSYCYEHQYRELGGAG